MSLHSILSGVSDRADIPAGWGQGRATYGGLVAALMQTALERQVSGDRPLRSATISFVGPLTTGEVSLQAELIRSGKSTLQAECRASQDGRTGAIMLACFGAGRSSELQVAHAAAPAMKAPEDCLQLPWIPGLTPEFTQQVELRWSQGGLPFSGHDSADIAGWVRLKDSPETLTPALVMALVDAWPPAVVARLKGPAPLSTMTWAMEYLAPVQPFARDGWWPYVAETVHAGEGYAQIRSSLWTPAGELAALGQQSVAIFA